MRIILILLLSCFLLTGCKANIISSLPDAFVYIAKQIDNYFPSLSKYLPQKTLDNNVVNTNIVKKFHIPPQAFIQGGVRLQIAKVCQEGSITKNICDEISSWEIPDGIFETEPTYEERIGYHLSCVAIVRVENKNSEPWSLGTGFYYDKNKLITNYHVIKSAKNIYVAQFTDYIEVKQGGSNTLKTARLIKSDPSNDIVILETLSENFSSCQFSDNSPDLLSEVIAIGHPNGLFYTLSKGDINAYRSKGKDFIQNKDSLEIYSIHMDAPIYPGSSGGPLFYKGKVVGVNYAGHEDTTLNFSIHFNVAKRFIK